MNEGTGRGKRGGGDRQPGRGENGGQQSKERKTGGKYNKGRGRQGDIVNVYWSLSLGKSGELECEASL